MKNDFEQIIRENAGILHKLCRVYTNDNAEYEELFQEMTIHIWQSLDNFRGEAQISTWLYRVCINTALNFRAKWNKTKRFVPLDADFPSNFQFESETNEQLQKLYRAIRDLKPVDRAVVSLYLDDKSYDETAQILGISKTNVATRLMRLKQKLIEKING